MRCYTFNRRKIVDQEIFVEARSYQEALKRARDGDCDDTADEVLVSMSIRPLKDTA